MLISVQDLGRRFNIKPTGVLHIGAHLGEESQDYINEGWGERQKIIWIESQPQLVTSLRNRLDSKNHEVIEATIWSESGRELTFNITNNSQSSSLLKLGTHTERYPEIKVVSQYQVITTTLKNLFPGRIEFDFINIDLQGSELEALKGFGNLPTSIKWIYTEVNKEEVYENCATIMELDSYLAAQGLTRIFTQWAIRKGWGDALYARPDTYELNVRNKFYIFVKYKIYRNLRGLISSIFT